MSAIVRRVSENPGSTASELRQIGEKVTTTRWALFGARKAGDVFQGSARTCRVTGRRARTWYPVQKTQSQQV